MNKIGKIEDKEIRRVELTSSVSCIGFDTDNRIEYVQFGKKYDYRTVCFLCDGEVFFTVELLGMLTVMCFFMDLGDVGIKALKYEDNYYAPASWLLNFGTPKIKKEIRTWMAHVKKTCAAIGAGGDA